MFNVHYFCKWTVTLMVNSLLSCYYKLFMWDWLRRPVGICTSHWSIINSGTNHEGGGASQEEGGGGEKGGVNCSSCFQTFIFLIFKGEEGRDWPDPRVHLPADRAVQRPPETWDHGLHVQWPRHAWWPWLPLQERQCQEDPLLLSTRGNQGWGGR